MREEKAAVTAFIGLGGNIGEPVAAMAAALRAFDAHGECRVDAVSRLYRTPPWGKTDQDWFFNAAAAIETTLPPEDLLALCLDIERSMKRVRIERWGPRTLDLDILAYGALVHAGDHLTLPHPRMKERAFVLMPLADFAPDYRIEGIPVGEWLDRVDSTGIEVADADSGWWRRH